MALYREMCFPRLWNHGPRSRAWRKQIRLAYSLCLGSALLMLETLLPFLDLCLAASPLDLLAFLLSNFEPLNKQCIATPSQLGRNCWSAGDFTISFKIHLTKGHLLLFLLLYDLWVIKHGPENQKENCKLFFPWRKKKLLTF